MITSEGHCVIEDIIKTEDMPNIASKDRADHAQ